MSACHVGPRYEKPSSDAPADWKGSSMESADAAVENWWDIFCDEKLDELERLTVENNRNLYMALEKVAEAKSCRRGCKIDSLSSSLMRILPLIILMS